MNRTEITMPQAAWSLARQSCAQEAQDMTRDKAWLGSALRQDYLLAARTCKAAAESGVGGPSELITYSIPDNVLFLLQEDCLLKAGETIARRQEA